MHMNDEQKKKERELFEKFGRVVYGTYSGVVPERLVEPIRGLMEDIRTKLVDNVAPFKTGQTVYVFVTQINAPIRCQIAKAEVLRAERIGDVWYFHLGEKTGSDLGEWYEGAIFGSKEELKAFYREYFEK